MILGIGAHFGRRRDPVRHVVEGGNRGDVPDIAVGKARISQLLAVGFDHFGRVFRQFDREFEHRLLAGGEVGGAPVLGDDLAEVIAFRALADGGAMGGQAVVAVVHRRDGDGDHLALELGQAAVGEHQIIDHVDEGFELAVVESVGLEHVRDEAELFLALGEVGFQLRRQFGILGHGEGGDFGFGHGGVPWRHQAVQASHSRAPLATGIEGMGAADQRDGTAMKNAQTPGVRSTGGTEYPTLALAVVIYTAWLGLTWFHAELPWWVLLPFAAWTIAWHGSLQHEILHGHPTRSRMLNTVLASPPLWLWMPFEQYRRTHLAHHHDERLTDPLDDPESRYVTPEDWAALDPVSRMLIHAQQTLLGRMVIGPIWAVGAYWLSEARTIASGDRDLARIWGWHLLGVTAVLGWVIGVCGMPLWKYLACFVYPGTALMLIRSFAEHRAAEAIAKRTIVVERAPILGLLFLNNNLHAVHHRWPATAWYRLPALYEQHRDEVLAANGGLVYRGYAQMFRRYFLRAYAAPVHPLGRVPDRTV